MNYSTNVLNGFKQVKPLHLHRTAGAVYPTLAVAEPVVTKLVGITS
jgi:hypothetical protein